MEKLLRTVVNMCYKEEDNFFGVQSYYCGSLHKSSLNGADVIVADCNPKGDWFDSRVI
jgi:hypothetical protein